MRPAIPVFVALTLAATVFAQDQDDPTTQRQQTREALLKELVAQDYGEVTAMEPSSSRNGGVVVGYASGTVLTCSGDLGCAELGGTPNTPVERIAVSSQDATDVIWLSYRQGALYRCVDGQCKKFTP